VIRKILYGIIILIGFLQIIGFVTTIQPIRSLGIVTASSPLPIVFTEVKGVETFASNFYIQFRKDNGAMEKIKITPELYSKFKGPYNRRNIYGAAISYGPVLPKTIWEPVLSYGLCQNVLRDELGIEVTTNEFSILIETRTEGRDDQWILDMNCDD